MALTFPTTYLKKPSGVTAIPSGLKRPAFGTLYGFDAQGGDGGGGAASPISNANSVNLDGANDYVEIDSSGTLGTLSLWFKSDWAISKSSALAVPIGFNGNVGLGGYGGIQFGSCTGAVTNEIISLVTGDWIYSYADASATIDTNWHHVAVRWAGSDYEIYLDGTQVKNTDGQWYSGSKAEISYSALEFGRRNQGTPLYDGKIDEVAIWHTALSASDTASLYNSGVPTDLSSLSPNGWWRCGDNDGGSGTTITDQGSGSNDGTLTNGASFTTDVPS